MKKMSTVDVIIPTYNGLPYLKQTVDSVLTQTHKNLELYIVDDGSTDKTEAYVKSLRDKRVHYIKKKNGGQSTARNLGIKQSNSPFVALLDSDDVWYPTKLEKQVELMLNNENVGLVYGHHYMIDEEDVIHGNLRIWKRGRIFEDLCGGNFIAGSASMVLIRRSVFEDVGLFHEDFLIGEDWEMWLRIAYKYEVDFVPEIVAALRQRSDGMQQNHMKMSNGLVYMLDVMQEEFDLTLAQRRTMAAYCLYHAAVGYNAAGRRDLARKTFLKLFVKSPRRIFDIDHWKLHIGFGIYTRTVLGNPVFDAIHWVYRQIVWLVGKILRIVFRTLNGIRRSLKK